MDVVLEQKFLRQLYKDLKTLQPLLDAKASVLGIPQDAKWKKSQGEASYEWLWDVEAEADPKFPYMVYNIVTDESDEDSVISPAVLTLHYYDANDLNTRIYAMAQAVKKALHGNSIDTDNNELTGRFYFQSGVRLATGNRTVKHYVQVIDLRLTENCTTLNPDL